MVAYYNEMKPEKRGGDEVELYKEKYQFKTHKELARLLRQKTSAGYIKKYLAKRT